MLRLGVNVLNPSCNYEDTGPRTGHVLGNICSRLSCLHPYRDKVHVAIWRRLLALLAILRR